MNFALDCAIYKGEYVDKIKNSCGAYCLVGKK
jgi:hypothetical protein